MDAISSIAGLLTLCGIASTRMFAPTFLFGAISRFLPAYNWCPQGIVDLAASCPSFLTSNFGLCVFGVLGVLEVIANWDDSIRELISESNIETYVKPVYVTLMSYSILTPEQVQVFSSVIGDATNVVSTASGISATESVTNIVASTMSFAAAALTGADTTVISNAVCTVTQEATDVVPASSGSTLSAIAASLFCCGGTFSLCKIRAGIVSAVRELDPDNALHLNTLLTMFEEGSWLTILPILLAFPIVSLLLMLALAAFGWLFSRPLEKLAEKRRAHWNAVGKEGMLKAVRNRAIAIFVAGVFLSAIPVLGYLSTVIALNLLVFGVLSMYEKPSSRIIAKLVMRFVKLTLLLIALFFSSIPFLGIILLLPHVVSYLMRVHNIKCRGCSQSGRILEGN